MTGQVWADWKALTRFAESGRIAFEREANLWGTLQLADRHEAKVTSSAGQGRYSISLDDHVSTMRDLSIFHASILIHTYTLAEFAACDRLAIDSRQAGGIEVWGTQLLTANSKSWQDVMDGLQGAVEVAVYRNAFAHGSRVVDAQAAKRLLAAGSTELGEGDSLKLDHDRLKLFRDRLRSLLRLGAIK